jgi:hypothetical protein
MSNLIQHAQYELDRAGLFDSDADYGGAHAHAVMELIKTFANQGHSGMSAAITLSLFSELAQFKPIGSVTSDPDEWVNRSDISGEPLWQNRRRGSTFSRDGGATWYDIEDAALNNGDVWKRETAA